MHVDNGKTPVWEDPPPDTKRRKISRGHPLVAELYRAGGAK